MRRRALRNRAIDGRAHLRDETRSMACQGLPIGWNAPHNNRLAAESGGVWPERDGGGMNMSMSDADSKSDEPVLLSGGNPQIAKGDGDAVVQRYIAAMPEWKQDIGRRIDAIVEQIVPGARKVVKWNTPFYGAPDGPPQTWFLSFHCFTKYVKVTFFRGTSLDPVPKGKSKHPEVRYYDIHEGQFDEALFAAWVKQASVLPGEKM